MSTTRTTIEVAVTRYQEIAAMMPRAIPLPPPEVEPPQEDPLLREPFDFIGRMYCFILGAWFTGTLFLFLFATLEQHPGLYSFSVCFGFALFVLYRETFPKRQE